MHTELHIEDRTTEKRAAFSPCVRGSWKLSPNPKLDVFGNTLGLCLTFKNSDGFGPPRFSQTYPFSSSLMTIVCIFSIFANFIALAFTSDRRFEKNFARDFIALAPSPVTYLLLAFRKNTSVQHTPDRRSPMADHLQPENQLRCSSSCISESPRPASDSIDLTLPLDSLIL